MAPPEAPPLCFPGVLTSCDEPASFQRPGSGLHVDLWPRLNKRSDPLPQITRYDRGSVATASEPEQKPNGAARSL